MELSGNARRAMDQVERNLSVLYGADYFTEEEWIKIDGLLHKGTYVLSGGPPNGADEEPLMTFDDAVKAAVEEKEEITEAVAEVADDQSFCQTRSDPLMDSDEESVSSPESQRSPVENSDETPADISDADALQQPKDAESVPKPQIADSTEAAIAQAEAPQPEIKAPEAPRYTQEQLDEVRAFNAGLTKAGKKTRPKYEKTEEEDYPEWNQGYDEPSMDEQAYPSPPQTEREARVDSWADGVAKLPPPHPSSHVESPMPDRSAQASAPAVELLAEQFIKAHGRVPRSLNDFYQPKNPAHQPKRPESQASSTTAKTSATLKSTAPQPPNNGIKPEKVYVAQSAAPRKGIRIEVRPGDPIKIQKYVSGIMYIGMNMRSGDYGQIPDTIFKRSSAPAPQVVKGRRGLDQFEHANAAEWDEVPSMGRSVAPSAPAASLGGGLAASRYSSAPERTPAKRTAPAPAAQQPGDIAADMAGQIGKIINEKFEEMLKTRMGAPTPRATPKPAQAPSRPAIHKPSPPPGREKGIFYVEPKTETCWFWSVKNDCRFTAEECRDLHAFIPNRTGTPKNLYKGKPTWGALVDFPDYVPPTTSDAQTANLLGGVFEEQKAKTSKTCYYWAVQGNCDNTAETCKYLHEDSPNGIAPKPGRSKATWKKDWRGSATNDAGEAESQWDGDAKLQWEETKSPWEAETKPTWEAETKSTWGTETKAAWEGDANVPWDGETADYVLEEVPEGYAADTWGRLSQRTEGAYKPPHARVEAQSTSGW